MVEGRRPEASTNGLPRQYRLEGGVHTSRVRCNHKPAAIRCLMVGATEETPHRHAWMVFSLPIASLQPRLSFLSRHGHRKTAATLAFLGCCLWARHNGNVSEWVTACGINARGGIRGMTTMYAREWDAHWVFTTRQPSHHCASACSGMVMC